MKVLANNIDLIYLRNQLLENKHQRKLEKQAKVLIEKKNSLVKLSKKSIEKQISYYKNFEELEAEFKQHQVANQKIDQIMSIERLNDEIFTYKSSIKESNKYFISPKDFSENKTSHYHIRLNNLKKIKYEKEDDYKWDKLNVRLYTAAEWIAEDWALKNKMQYHDYNQVDQMSPQDCRINGINIDVKTTLGVGCKRLKTYYSSKGTSYENEIILGITSLASKRDIIGTSEDYSEHSIHGIFDPSVYKNINLELNHFPVSTKLINACYFQPLQNFFNRQPNFENIINNYEDDVLNHLIKTKKSLPAIFYLILNYFPKKLDSALKSVLPAIHYDLIEIITELNTKDSIPIFPHYLANHLMNMIHKKKTMDPQVINLIINSISLFHEDQHKYVNNLLKLSTVLPKVRCKFHSNETMKEMDITEGERVQGPTPTFYAQCSKDPTKRTTIFTHSWQTGETVIYGNKDIKVCDYINCGCLTHPDRRVFKQAGLRFGRYECKKYGHKKS